ncbi:MAG: hypothetical protein M0R03_16650 [Novosphingobium sp.]|nr:hypothetical protein [Novosphingobium sp.]
MRKLILLLIFINLVNINNLNIAHEDRVVLFNAITIYNLLGISQDISKIEVLASKDINKIYIVSAIELYRHIIYVIINSSTIDLKFIANIKFIFDNFIIYKNAKRIARYNRLSKRDLSKSKQNQYIWLSLNNLVACIGFFAERIYKRDHKFKIFTVINTLKIASSISEILRKNQLYNLEIGEYRNYRKELE